MRYHVCRTKTGGWYVIEEEWAGGKRVVHRRLRKGMPPFEHCTSYDQARSLKKILDAAANLQRSEQARAGALARTADASAVASAALPQAVLLEFERDVVALSGKKKHWAAARLAIATVGIVPAEWRIKKELLWAYFANKKWSPSYIREIRSWINRWGEFYSFKTRLGWQRLPTPNGTLAVRIRIQYEQASERRRPSGRLSFKRLREHRRKLSKSDYRGLFISIAFGLRPDEMTISLKQNKKWGELKDALHVYQTKLERYEPLPQKRWKAIPIKTPQQRAALKFILSRRFTFPSAREFKKLKIKDHKDRRVHLNGGRKEFVPYMLVKGFGLADISLWMGHASIDTTKEFYDDPFSYDPFSEAA